MNLLIAEVVELFLLFLWPMIRVSALMLTAPLFSLNAVNVRLRVLLAFLLTWMIFPLHEWPMIDPFSAAGVREVFVQIGIGAMMGLILQVVTAAVVVAGQAISGLIGLAMANMIDPNVGNVPVLAQLLQILSILVFLGLGGHLVLISVVLESFYTAPIGAIPDLDFLYRMFLSWTAMIFLGALLIALPVLGIMLLVQIGMGIITRAAPALNIFAVGFPMLLLLGILFIFLALPVMVSRIENLWLLAFLRLQELIGMA